jgi:fused signal recognition particle receptor
MFKWLWSSDNKLKIFQEKYKENKKDLQNLLSILNFLQEDIEKINLKKIKESIQDYINVTFKPHEKFYNQWNNIDDIKKIIHKKINIIYFFGNNGIGKTTSIVNFAKILKDQGYNPLLVGADEFRGGAVEQLIAMANLYGIPVYSSVNYPKAPSLSQIIFDGIQKNYENYNVILIDTSGRSHTDLNLVESLHKQYNLSFKALEGVNDYEVLSIWCNDGNIVNGFQQQKLFFNKIKVDYIIMTKIRALNPYYNFLNIINNVKTPIIFYGPNATELKIFNKKVFEEEMS